jgi:hypothetical protein
MCTRSSGGGLIYAKSQSIWSSLNSSSTVNTMNNLIPNRPATGQYDSVSSRPPTIWSSLPVNLALYLSILGPRLELVLSLLML